MATSRSSSFLSLSWSIWRSSSGLRSGGFSPLKSHLASSSPRAATPLGNGTAGATPLGNGTAGATPLGAPPWFPLGLEDVEEEELESLPASSCPGPSLGPAAPPPRAPGMFTGVAAAMNSTPALPAAFAISSREALSGNSGTRTAE